MHYLLSRYMDALNTTDTAYMMKIEYPAEDIMIKRPAGL